MNAINVWSVQWMQCNKQEDSYTDVVIVVGWSCVSTFNEFTAKTSGACNVLPPTGQFTPYDDLTQEQVLNWIWSEQDGVNKTEVEAMLALDIENQMTSQVIELPLPWSSQ